MVIAFAGIPACISRSLCSIPGLSGEVWFSDDSIGTIQPTHKARWLILLGRDALVVMYHRHKAAPLTCLSSFTDGWRGLITDMLAIPGSHGLVLSCSFQSGYLVCLLNSGEVNINGAVGKSLSDYLFNVRQVNYLGSTGKCSQHSSINHGESADHQPQLTADFGSIGSGDVEGAFDV